ncbi:MAG: hypothetical protein LBS59_00985 [Puniceicoccales bacterium]|jgi:hypothetical protein|nr:hypothetical protein [Puniceicoccales bacterium]
MLNNFPKHLNPGDPLTASWLNQLLAAARANTPRGGPGILATRDSTGTVLTARRTPAAPPQNTQNTVVLGFLQPILTTTKGTNPQPAWSVTPGFVGGGNPPPIHMPNGVTLGRDPSDNTIPSDDPADWSQPCREAGAIYLRAVKGSGDSTTGRWPAQVHIHFQPGNADTPAPESIEEEGYLLIGRVYDAAATANPPSSTKDWAVQSLNNRNKDCQQMGGLWLWWGL